MEYLVDMVTTVPDGTMDAIFQGLHPYAVGQAGVAAYYADQPTGMTAAYTLRETRALSDGLVRGYLTVGHPVHVERVAGFEGDVRERPGGVVVACQEPLTVNS